MFKIDKSVVQYLDTNKSSVIIKQWAKQDVQELQLAAADEENGLPRFQQSFQQPQQPGQTSAGREGASDRIQAQKEIESKHREAAVACKRAEQEADRLLREANAKIGAMFEEARREGYAKGCREAREEAKEQALLRERECERFFSQLREAVGKRQDERDQEMEQNILAISAAIAKKIINIRLEKDDIVFMGLVREAVKRLNAKERFTIHVNEREYERFFQKGGGWLSDATQCAPFHVLPDADIQPGGLVLVSSAGRVDAGIETQVQKLAGALHVDAQEINDVEL